MQAERQALVRVVFPALRERLARHRVHLVDIDLRWGVTREEAENDGALDFCLNQVEACRPFFVGILGQRYGWTLRQIPSRALRRWPWLADHAGRSITELEMVHGSLQTTIEGSRACFYFRDPLDPASFDGPARSAYVGTDEEAHRLADLKDRIRAHGAPVLDGYRCRWDPGTRDDIAGVDGRIVLDDEFAERVDRDLWTGLCAHLGIDGNATGEPDAIDEAAQADSEADDYERFMRSAHRPGRRFSGARVGRSESANRPHRSRGDGYQCRVFGRRGSPRHGVGRQHDEVVERVNGRLPANDIRAGGDSGRSRIHDSLQPEGLAASRR